MIRTALILAMALCATACASPRVGLGVGYGIGDVRVGVSSSDLGRSVTPSIGVRSGHFYGWTSGPRIPLRQDPAPVDPYDPYAAQNPGGAVVRGRPAPGVGG